MKIGPISTIVFKNSQPLRAEMDDKKSNITDFVTVFLDQPDGTRKEVRMSGEEYDKYSEQEKLKTQERLKQEQLKKEQDWIANINRPQTYHK